MARTIKQARKAQSEKRENIKYFLFFLAIYLGIFAIASLFVLKQIRHFWISHTDEPISGWTVKGSDVEKEKNYLRGEDKKEYDDVYYLLVDYQGKEYKSEIGEALYFEREYDPQSYAEKEKEFEFYYDQSRDEVFMGGYYSGAAWTILIIFIVGFLFFFVWAPRK